MVARRTVTTEFQELSLGDQHVDCPWTLRADVPELFRLFCWKSTSHWPVILHSSKLSAVLQVLFHIPHHAWRGGATARALDRLSQTRRRPTCHVVLQS